MYIQKLTIENIRGLKHFEMTFPDNPAGWHVIIGDNGAGKSTLIRAISLGLIGPNEVRAAHPNFAEWLRKGEKKGLVELVLQGDKQHDYTLKLGKTGKLNTRVLLQSAPLGGLRGGTPLVEAIGDDNAKVTPDKYLWSSTSKGWFSAGFGPFRRFTGGDTELDKVYLSSPRCGAHLSVFGEDVALTEVLNWLKEIDYQQLKAREKKIRQNAVALNLADNGTLSNGSKTEIITEVKQLWEMAARMRKNSLFEEAESLLRQALALIEKAPEDRDSIRATGLNNLALLLQDTNQISEAESLMRQALAINEKLFGPEHPRTANSLNNLAHLFHSANRLVDAEILMRRALAISEASYGPDHPNVSTTLNNLASLLQTTNRLSEAESFYRRSLAIDVANFGPDHPNVAIRLNNLATLLQDTNRLFESEALVRQALAIDEFNFGTDHPQVATSLNNLANLLRYIHRLPEAEPLFRRSLAIIETTLGPNHPNLATSLNNLAGLLQDTGRLSEAESLYRRALAINEASFGINHPNVASSLSNLASLLRDTNRLAEAEPLMHRALAIDEASFGNAHPIVSIRLNNLAGLLQDTGRLSEAESLYRRALAISEASFGINHPSVATRLNNLANLFRDTNRITEAETFYRRALTIDEASFSPAHPGVVTEVQNLVSLLQATDRLDEANALEQEYEAKRIAISANLSAVTEAGAPQKLPIDENVWLGQKLRTFINESNLLPNGTEFKEISADGPIFRDSNGQMIAITELSDGFRSILSLAFELVRQLIRVYGLAAVFPLNGKSGVIELPGVVLIDEVDTHLHPTWQTRIGQWFTKCFPQIQFIVTTHTPIICRAVTDTTGSIWRLPTPGQGQKVEEVTGPEKLRLRLGNVLDAYGTGLFGGQEVEQSAEATALLAERAKLSAKDAAGKATPAERARLRELQQLFSSVDAEVEY